MTLWFQLYFPLLHSWRMCGVWQSTLASFNTPPEEFHVLTTKQASNFCPVVRAMLCHSVIVSQPGKMSMMHLLCVHMCVSGLNYSAQRWCAGNGAPKVSPSFSSFQENTHHHSHSDAHLLWSVGKKAVVCWCSCDGSTVQTGRRAKADLTGCPQH